MIFDEYGSTVPEDNNVDDSYQVPGDVQEDPNYVVPGDVQEDPNYVVPGDAQEDPQGNNSIKKIDELSEIYNLGFQICLLYTSPSPRDS